MTSSAAQNPMLVPGSMGRIVLTALSRFPDRVAVVDDRQSWTYRDLSDKVARAIAVLKSLGVKTGEGIAILSSNRAEFVAVEIAAMLMGLRYTALHPLASADTHLFILEDAEIAVLVIDPPVARYNPAELVDKVPTLRHVLTFGRTTGTVDLLGAMEKASPGPLLDEAPPDSLVRVFYTGGTTGKPKGVMLSHRAMVTTTVLQASEWDLPRDNLTYLAATPVSHASGTIVPTILMLGGKTRLIDGFSAEKFCSVVESEKVSTAFLVPTMIYVLLDYAGRASYDLSSLNTVIYGAAPMSPDRLRIALDTFGPIFVQLYGQTESPNCITTLRKSDHDPRHPLRLGSCGFPSPHVHVALFDGEMREVEDGMPGEICVRGPLIMSGYWKRPEATEEAFRGGWLHTGDVAIRSTEGYLTIVDRTKDMIISGGFNIYPREVEDALLTHPDVALAAVIGVPDEKWGEAVTAFVVVRDGGTSDPAALKAHVRALRGPIWAPKTIHFVESIPLTPLGKLDRKALRSAVSSRGAL